MLSRNTLPTLAQLNNYVILMRANSPVGSYLLLWPALWALWIAADGMPSLNLLIIFSLGVFLTRSAGCVINDYADRKIDGHVKRTTQRPIATGKVSPKEALYLFAGLMLLAFVLVLFTNTFTVMLSFGALALAACYPFMKRYTHLPQVVLGAAFAWSVPMAFAATNGTIPAIAWVIYFAVCTWTVAYDTLYAMVDRDDDLLIGVKSTAILFGRYDLTIVSLLMAAFIGAMIMVGICVGLSTIYFISLATGTALLVRQLWQCRSKARLDCFEAFTKSHYVGLVILIGIIAHYALIDA